jgi:hypothetical protein
MPRENHQVLPDRRLKQVGTFLDRPCGLCSSNVALVTESRRVRRGLAWLNPLWDDEPELFEVCAGCHARRLIERDQLPR